MTGTGRRRPAAVLAPVRDSLRTQLWPVPMAGVALAVAAGVGLPRLDARIDDRLPAGATAYLFGGGAEAARAVLSAVAGSLITVTSLTFSLTVVTLQLASSQFSPRLLRTFTRDRFVHVTLALFLATFSYALTVLRVVRGSSGSEDEFVPQISVTAAFVLAIASVAGLVLFLAHLAREIRVETMLQKVHRDAEDALGDAVTDGDDGAAAPQPPASARPVPARSSGFLVQVDEAALLTAAVAADAVVRVDRAPGSFLVAGAPLARTWSAKPGRPPAPELSDQVAASVTVGIERTQVQDAAFGLRQLTDVAVKALSPGINDPTTAVYALGHASALLCTLARHDPGPRLLRDERGAVRVLLDRPDFAELLELAVAQPRRYGAADPVVLGSLASLLSDVAWCARTHDQRAAVASQLTRLRATAAAQDLDPTERAHLAAATGQVEHALAGRWAPGG